MTLNDVSASIRSELLKLRTTRTTLWVLASMFGVIGVAAAVHFAGFDVTWIDEVDEQRRTLTNIGLQMGLIFAAIAGAASVTNEYRYGTIRPTLTKQPRRSLLLGAKAIIHVALGAITGALAASYATGLAWFILRIRDSSIVLSSGQVGRLIVAGLVGGAAFGLLGLALGTVARNQAVVVVGVLIWMLFIESLMRAGIPAVAKFGPGSMSRAIAAPDVGQLSSVPAAAALLIALSGAVFSIAIAVFAHRDIT